MYFPITPVSRFLLLLKEKVCTAYCFYNFGNVLWAYFGAVKLVKNWFSEPPLQRTLLFSDGVFFFYFI